MIAENERDTCPGDDKAEPKGSRGGCSYLDIEGDKYVSHGTLEEVVSRKNLFRAYERELLRKVLSRERPTRMEGSLGTQKVHYSLLEIRAHKQETELLWIFFGIHTANAVKMIEKMEKKSLKQSA